jgi:acetyl-CoA C-acetyltransferase
VIATGCAVSSLGDVGAHDDTPVLADGARTPIGRFGRALAAVDPIALGAHAVRESLARCADLTPDHVLLGNVLQAANGQNPARQAAIRGGVARDTPGTTINDVCLASMTSVAMAAAMVREREADTVLVGGFDSMSLAPHAVRRTPDDEPLDLMVHDGLYCSMAGVGMGELSDAENERLEVTRAAQDMLALRSHERAAAATAEGRLAEEIAPLPELATDEGIRADTSLEKLAALQPAFGERGTITAGNASQMSDGGAAGLVTTLGRARAAGVAPLAEVAGRAMIAGPDSSLHLRPAEASAKLLERHGLTPADVDLWEINEAFAGVVVASCAALGIDPERVNVNGGAVAIGHPLAASGMRLVLTLAYEMRRRGAELGVATLCGGGGQGEALLLRAA